MQNRAWCLILISCLFFGCHRAAPADAEVRDAIVALEQTALDRWGKGDPQGFFDIMSDDETYFDPTLGKRIDGKEALRTFIAPFAGKISIDRFEMIGPSK